MDVAQALEDILEELGSLQKAVNKLTTASVSGQALRTRVKDTHKAWLRISGALEGGSVVNAADVQEVADAWAALAKLANKPSPKKQYKAHLKTIVAKTETDLLYPFIKGSAIQTIGDTLRKLVQPVSDPELLKYLDESIRCAESTCVRGSVVLAWCAVAHVIHRKLSALGISALNTAFTNMKADKGLMFKAFNRDYVFSTEPDIQEAADAHLILLCRFLDVWFCGKDVVAIEGFEH